MPLTKGQRLARQMHNALAKDCIARGDFEWQRTGGSRCEASTVWEGEWRWIAVRAAARTLCTRAIEFVQCGGDEKGGRGCGDKWLRQPWQQSVDDWGWCPGCGNWSTWDVDAEFQLIGYPEATCL